MHIVHPGYSYHGNLRLTGAKGVGQEKPNSENTSVVNTLRSVVRNSFYLTDAIVVASKRGSTYPPTGPDHQTSLTQITKKKKKKEKSYHQNVLR